MLAFISTTGRVVREKEGTTRRAHFKRVADARRAFQLAAHRPVRFALHGNFATFRLRTRDERITPHDRRRAN